MMKSIERASFELYEKEVIEPAEADCPFIIVGGMLLPRVQWNKNDLFQDSVM